MFTRFDFSVLPAAAILGLTLSCGGQIPPAYDVPPVLANREEITEALRAVGGGLEAQVVLFVRVDERGRVRNVRIAQSSGDEELDDAARWIGEQMRFEPAQYEGRAVAALVQVPVTFDVVSSVTRAPRLRNAPDVEAAIARLHADLRGEARFKIRVSSEGEILLVKDARATDADVQSVARDLVNTMEFWPALESYRPVDAWVDVVLEFKGPRSRVRIESSET